MGFFGIDMGKDKKVYAGLNILLALIIVLNATFDVVNGNDAELNYEYYFISTMMLFLSIMCSWEIFFGKHLKFMISLLGKDRMDKISNELRAAIDTPSEGMIKLCLAAIIIGATIGLAGFNS